MLGFSPPGKTTFADDNIYIPKAPFNFPEFRSEGSVATADNGSQYIFSGAKWQVAAKSYSYKGAVLESVSNATAIDLTDGNFFSLDLSQNTTISFNNPPSAGTAQTFQILLKASATISVVWPATVLWESGSAPTPPELGQTDILVFYTSDVGSTYYGKLKEDNVS